MHLVVTRPQPDADRQAALLRSLGHRVTVEPLLRVEFLTTDVDLAGVQAVVVTSRNALRALAETGALPGAAALPVFAVGRATAKLAGDLGFATVTEGSGTGAELARTVAERCDPQSGSILHLAGEQLAADVAGDLEALGFTAIVERVYRTVPAAELSAALCQAVSDGEIDGVLLMSPATARAWGALVTTGGCAEAAASLLYFCLSDAVAAGLSTLNASDIHVAAMPREDDLLALIAREAAH